MKLAKIILHSYTIIGMFLYNFLEQLLLQEIFGILCRYIFFRHSLKDIWVIFPSSFLYFTHMSYVL